MVSNKQNNKKLKEIKQRTVRYQAYQRSNVKLPTGGRSIRVSREFSLSRSGPRQAPQLLHLHNKYNKESYLLNMATSKIRCYMTESMAVKNTQRYDGMMLTMVMSSTWEGLQTC